MAAADALSVRDRSKYDDTKGLALGFNSVAPRRRCLFTFRLCDGSVPWAKASLGTELESNVIL
jgi:hypothetical protein